MLGRAICSGRRQTLRRSRIEPIAKRSRCGCSIAVRRSSTDANGRSRVGSAKCRRGSNESCASRARGRSRSCNFGRGRRRACCAFARQLPIITSRRCPRAERWKRSSQAISRQHFPDVVPRIIAAEPARRWLLMKACRGQKLEEIADIAVWERAANRYARLQVGLHRPCACLEGTRLSGARSRATVPIDRIVGSGCGAAARAPAA